MFLWLVVVLAVVATNVSTNPTRNAPLPSEEAELPLGEPGLPGQPDVPMADREPPVHKNGSKLQVNGVDDGDCLGGCGLNDTVGCPGQNELPIISSNNREFIGARLYGYGDSLPPLSCGGSTWDFPSGYRSDNAVWWLGALYVHPGCTLYTFEDYNYQGKHRVFEGPLFLPCVDPDNQGKYCRYHAHSMIVECSQQLPDCVPSDEWSTVGYFDNTQSPLTSTYTYSYSIGTSFSVEVMHSISVSASVEFASKTNFFGLFKTHLSVSASTGYNWSRTSTQVQNQQTTHSVSTEVPGGMTIEVQQAKGTCGNSVVETEMFRSVVTGKDGKQSLREFVHGFH